MEKISIRRASLKLLLIAYCSFVGSLFAMTPEITKELSKIKKFIPKFGAYVESLINLEDQKKAYNDAIKKTKIHPISQKTPQLNAIAPWNKNLIWNKQKTHILMTSVMGEWFTTNKWKPFIGKTFIIDNSKAAYQQRRADKKAEGKTVLPFDGFIEVWVAPAPQVNKFLNDFFKDILGKISIPMPAADTQEAANSIYNTIFTRRLDQYLGLIPTDGKKYVVEMWVRPIDLFRPCLDEEILDEKCILDPEQDELGTAFSNLFDFLTPTSTDYINWYKWRRANLYGQFEPGQSVFPWWRLGATYDWGQTVPGGALDTQSIGQSEYVIKFLDKKPRDVKVRGIYTPYDYFFAKPPTSGTED